MAKDSLANRSLKQFRKSAHERLRAQAGSCSSIRSERRRAAKIDAARGPAGPDYPQLLRDNLLGLFFGGELSAAKLVKLCMLIERSKGAGVDDLARDIKYDKNAAAVVCKSLGGCDVRRHCLHHTVMPVNTRRGRLADRQAVATVPFYEVVALRFARDEALLFRHREQPDLLCDNFYDHDVVKGSTPELVMPMRLFVDYATLDGQATTLNIPRLRLHPPTRAKDPEGPGGSQYGPGGPQDGPGGSQKCFGGPNRVPREPRRAPRVPRRVPRGARGEGGVGSKNAQECPNV